IFGNNFEPVAHRLARQNVLVVRRAQANPDSILRKSIKSICRHFRGLHAKQEGGRAIVTSPPTRKNRQSNIVSMTAVPSLRPASLTRRSRSRPCPCKSSCPCNRCHRPCSRPCPCRSFGPYKRAFPSPSCQTSSLCP